MTRLAGKVAIVFGAGSMGPGWGNGKATAALFAREGAAVLAVDVNEGAAAETARLIAEEGGRSAAATANVAADAEVRQAVETCLSRFGRIDILQNNVGIHRLGGPTDHSEEDWDLVLATNLKGLFLTCRHVLPVMERQGAGAIVNIASISGLRYMGMPTIAYSTAKGAVLSYTRSIAAQYGPKGIRANVVTPGIIDTPLMRIASDEAYAKLAGTTDVASMHAARQAIVPLNRFGSPWDVAEASLFLASDAAGYVTGTDLMVDGGLSCVAPKAALPG
jgi:NAD(P)-dependent dehydrogenase (short-subunit alcohol dehydrogenase family)